MCKPLRAAPKLKPPALPGDTYFLHPARALPARLLRRDDEDKTRSRLSRPHVSYHELRTSGQIGLGPGSATSGCEQSQQGSSYSITSLARAICRQK
jgi:hypothetical protein